jgi:hypothetical protein
VAHALPNALLPAITILAIDFGLLIGGIVVIETVFAYPGLGRLLVFAIEHHDLPLLQAGMMVSRRSMRWPIWRPTLLRRAQSAHPRRERGRVIAATNAAPRAARRPANRSAVRRRGAGVIVVAA